MFFDYTLVGIMLKLKSANILQISDGEICAQVAINNIGQISLGEH